MLSKIISIIVLSAAMVSLAWSKHITAAECFFDTDPGQGNGTVMSGSFGDSSATAYLNGISTTGLSLGTHVLFIRMLDSEGVWGAVTGHFVNIGTADIGDIVQAEYFIDDDPGAGAGSPLSGVFGNPQVTASANGVSTSELELGTHTVFTRMKNDAGEWGDVRGTPLNIAYDYDGFHLTQAEVFIDDDPGWGNGTTMSAVDGSFDEAVEDFLANALATNTLSGGIHTVFVRSADNRNGWGLPRGSWLQIQYPPNTPGNCISLDGNGDYIQIADDPALNPQSITIEAWVYVNSFGDWEGIVTKGTESYESYSLCLVTNPNRFRFEAHWPNVQMVESEEVESGQWYHVAAAFSAFEAAIYVDGIEHNTATWQIYNLNPSSGGILSIGNNHPGADECFDGYIDEVRIWDYARTQPEIQENMNASVPITSPGLIAYYKLDEPITWQETYGATGAHNGIFVGDAHLVESTAPLNIIAPNIAVSPASIYFDLIDYGTCAIEHLFVLNTGNEDLIISSIESDHPDFGSPQSLPAVIPPGDDLDLLITFNTTVNGAAQGEITIVSNDPGTPELDIPVSGSVRFSTDFEFGVDNYSFENEDLETWYPYTILNYPFLSSSANQTLAGIHNLTRLLSKNGNCYGMAVSSIDFYNYPDLLLPYGVWNTNLLPEAVAIPIILDYQNIQQIENLIQESIEYYLQPNSDEEIYYEIRSGIINDDPIAVSLRDPAQNANHSVAAYEVLDYCDFSRIIIYENNDMVAPGTLKVDYLPNLEFQIYQFSIYDFQITNALNPNVIPTAYQINSMISAYVTVFCQEILSSGNRFFSFLKNTFAGTDTPDNILITDNLGRMIGIWDGTYYNEIPGAEILDSLQLECYLPEDLTYSVEYESNSPGKVYFAGLCPSQLDEDAIYSTAYDSMGVLINSTASFTFDAFSTSDIAYDLDGDQIVDTLASPLVDSVMTMVPPETPINFTVEIQSQRKTSISWQSASPTALGTVLQRQIIPDTTWEIIYLGCDSTYLDTMLTANTSINCRAYDYTAGGNSDYTQVISVTTPPMPVPLLSLPADSAEIMPGEITFHWESVQDAAEYHLQVAADTGFVNLPVDEDALQDTLYVFSDTLEFGWYYWRVQAADIVPNWSDWAETRVFGYGAGIPVPVERLVLQISGEDVVLTWEAVTEDVLGSPVEIDHYTVYRSDEPYFDISGAMNSFTADSTVFIDSGAASENSCYFYLVTANIDSVTAVSSPAKSQGWIRSR